MAFGSEQLNALRNDIRDRLFYRPTGLIYDSRVTAPDSGLPCPTAGDIREQRPNSGGNGTVIEDCMLAGGTLAGALLSRSERTGDREDADFCRQLIGGMLKSAEAGKDGFLPRGVSPLDGSSHYGDTSRDQYTMFLYAVTRYAASALCTEEERDRIRRIVCRIADRAIRHVTPDNDWNLMTEDGRPGLTLKMWGDLCTHEWFRLPMFYLAAYTVSGEDRYREEYLRYRDPGLDRSLPLCPDSYWALYTLQQMACSVDLARRFDPDPDVGRKSSQILKEIAVYVSGLVPAVAERNRGIAPEDFRRRGDYRYFYFIQDAAIIPMLQGMAPEGTVTGPARALCEDHSVRLCVRDQDTALPVHFYAAWETILRQG